MLESSHRTKGLLRLTMACNERCPFCNVPQEDYAHPTPTPAEVEAELAEFVGEQTLTISGGEPTLLRRRLLALVKGARERAIGSVELQTNAILIDAAYAGELAEAGLTSAFVSLLSDQPAHHDALAGLDGAFERCLAGIDALLDAGVWVTLNPVLARRTQERVVDYVRFVATRLPRVRSISLSAVQPHGRAARDGNLELLLPDYAVLAGQVPEALALASAHGIELLNPYCGLPLCIGWTAGRERSVEAIEAIDGGWRPTPGIENQGDKVHGRPCVDCAWRTRCGGAWRAYWDLRCGSGIAAPSRSVAPWAEGDAPDQTVVEAAHGIDTTVLAALRAAKTPTVWLYTAQLSAPEGLLQSGCTDLALALDATGLGASAAPRATLRTLAALKTVLAGTAGAAAAQRLRVHLRLVGGSGPDRAALVAWARQHGVDHIRQR